MVGATLSDDIPFEAKRMKGYHPNDEEVRQVTYCEGIDEGIPPCRGCP